MLTIVATRNVGNQPPERIFMITKAAQTNIEDDEDVIIVLIEEEAMNQS
jgi:hypothetical protein